MGIDVCFFPIFHSSSLLPTALPSPFKYVEEAEHLVRMLGFFLFFYRPISFCRKWGGGSIKSQRDFQMSTLRVLICGEALRASPMEPPPPPHAQTENIFILTTLYDKVFFLKVLDFFYN